MEGTIEREERIILLTMLGDIRAEVEGIHDILRGDEGEEETEENA